MKLNFYSKTQPDDKLATNRDTMNFHGKKMQKGKKNEENPEKDTSIFSETVRHQFFTNLQESLHRKYEHSM